MSNSDPKKEANYFEYSSWTVAQLQRELRNQGMRTAGRKIQLVHRLLGREEDAPTPNPKRAHPATPSRPKAPPPPAPTTHQWVPFLKKSLSRIVKVELEKAFQPSSPHADLAEANREDMSLMTEHPTLDLRNCHVRSVVSYFDALDSAAIRCFFPGKTRQAVYLHLAHVGEFEPKWGPEFRVHLVWNDKRRINQLEIQVDLERLNWALRHGLPVSHQRLIYSRISKSESLGECSPPTPRAMVGPSPIRWHAPPLSDLPVRWEVSECAWWMSQVEREQAAFPRYYFPSLQKLLHQVDSQWVMDPVSRVFMPHPPLPTPTDHVNGGIIVVPSRQDKLHLTLTLTKMHPSLVEPPPLQLQGFPEDLLPASFVGDFACMKTAATLVICDRNMVALYQAWAAKEPEMIMHCIVDDASYLQLSYGDCFRAHLIVLTSSFASRISNQQSPYESTHPNHSRRSFALGADLLSATNGMELRRRPDALATCGPALELFHWHRVIHQENKLAMSPSATYTWIMTDVAPSSHCLHRLVRVIHPAAVDATYWRSDNVFHFTTSYYRALPTRPKVKKADDTPAKEVAATGSATKKEASGGAAKTKETEGVSPADPMDTTDDSGSTPAAQKNAKDTKNKKDEKKKKKEEEDSTPAATSSSSQDKDKDKKKEKDEKEEDRSRKMPMSLGEALRARWASYDSDDSDNEFGPPLHGLFPGFWRPMYGNSSDEEEDDFHAPPRKRAKPNEEDEILADEEEEELVPEEPPTWTRYLLNWHPCTIERLTAQVAQMAPSLSYLATWHRRVCLPSVDGQTPQHLDELQSLLLAHVHQLRVQTAASTEEPSPPAPTPAEKEEPAKQVAPQEEEEEEEESAKPPRTRARAQKEKKKKEEESKKPLTRKRLQQRLASKKKRNAAQDDEDDADDDEDYSMYEEEEADAMEHDEEDDLPTDNEESDPEDAPSTQQKKNEATPRAVKLHTLSQDIQQAKGPTFYNSHVCGVCHSSQILLSGRCAHFFCLKCILTENEHFDVYSPQEHPLACPICNWRIDPQLAVARDEQSVKTQQHAQLTQLSHVYGSHLGMVVCFLLDRLRVPSPGRFLVVCGWEDPDNLVAALQRQEIPATNSFKKWNNPRLKCPVLVLPNVSALTTLPSFELDNTLYLVVTHYQSDKENTLNEQVMNLSIQSPTKALILFEENKRSVL